MQTKLNAVDFSLILKTINTIKDEFSSLVIKNGIICGMSDNKQCIYKISLQDVMGEEQMSFSNTSNKLKLLDVLTKQKNDVSIDSNEENISFIEESGSTIQFRNMDDTYISDIYMEEDSFNSTMKLDTFDKLIEFNLEGISEKISKFSDSLSCQGVTFVFEKEKVDILMRSMDNSNNVLITVHSIEGDDVIDKSIKGKAGFSVQPFIDLYNSTCIIYNDKENDRLILEVNGYLTEDKIYFQIFSIGVLEDETSSDG